VLAVEPVVGPTASAALTAASVVELIRPYHGVVVHGDMSGDLGAAYQGDHPRPDLTMVSVAAALEAAGRRVQVRDDNAFTGSPPAAPDAPQPDVRLVKLQLATWRDDLRHVDHLRAQDPAVPVVVFGAVTSYLPHLDPDLAVHGDATRAISELLGAEQLSVGRAYRLFPLDQYRDENGNRRVHLQASRGCNRTCRYCPYIRVQGRWAARTLPELAEDIRWLDELGVHRIQFRDQDFPSDPGHAVEAAGLIAESSGGRARWSVEGNLDRFTTEVVQALRECGCNEIIIGIESTDPHVLRAARRRVLTDSEERIHAIARAGVPVRGLFMVGLPEDNWARVAATVCTALALPLHAAQFNVYSPLPGESFGTDHTVGVDDFVPNGNNYRYRTCRAMTAMEVRLAAALAGQAFAAHRAGDPAWQASLDRITARAGRLEQRRIHELAPE
jgi:radical SAM superfamily enzyme YgiQ (UPF0313 family)